MGILDWLKGVFNRMLGREDIQSALRITPIVSDTMRNAIELWEDMYMNKSPWLNDKVHSLSLAALIASEKARMATLELEVKVTGENDRAKYVKDSFKQVEKTIRKQLEYGIAMGGLVIKPYVVLGPNDMYKIKFTYVKANDFYPLSFSADGELTSAAFIDRIISGDKCYSKLEIHSLVANTVIVQNKAFEADYKPQNTANSHNVLGNEISLQSIPEWSNIAPEVTLPNVDTLLFAYFKNPESNTVDMNSPLGISGFSRAVSLIKEADEQYSNLLWEFEGGQLAIDVDRTALNFMRSGDGRETQVLPKLQDRLYRRQLDLGDDNMYNVFSPSLRDDSILNGLNNILMHIEDVCSLARGTISETDVTEARTATELKILKQRAYSANCDVQKELQECFEKLFHIIDIYCDLYEIVADGAYEVAYNWDDSILVDKDTERQLDIVDINNGLMARVEYRMKWFGETELQAEESLQKILQEQRIRMEIQMQHTSTPDGGDPKTAQQEKLDAQNRAKESNELTLEE